jgi:hypothetical protein
MNVIEFIRDHKYGFYVTDQGLIRFPAFIGYWRKWEYNETAHKVFELIKPIIIEEESIVQYSHKFLGTHKTSQVGYNVFR